LSAEIINRIDAVADLGFFRGVTSGTRRKLRRSGLTGGFNAFVNYDVGITTINKQCINCFNEWII